MKVQLHSTSKIVEINGVPARIWEGVTESGVGVHAYITRIAVDKDESPAALKIFEEDLQEHDPPSAVIEAIPLRLII